MFAPLKRIIFLAAILLMLPASAFAAVTVNSITLNDAEPLPSGVSSLNVTINVECDGQSPNIGSFNLLVDGSIYACANINDVTCASGGAVNRTNDYTGAPLAPKDSYQLTVLPYSDNGCGSEITDNVTNTASDTALVSQTDRIVKFRVTKQELPDLNTSYNVSISCDNGTIAQTNGSIVDSATGSHTFVVENIDPDDPSNVCTIKEAGPGTHITTYAANSVDQGGGGCTFTGGSNMIDNNQCVVTNTARDATFRVNKRWVTFNEGGDVVDREAWINIECDATITNDGGADTVYNNGMAAKKKLTGNTYFQVAVKTSTATGAGGRVYCSTYETVFDSAVEQSDNCADSYALRARGHAECTFTNTVFFEGIPTLSEYGLAIMALLMLGVGFVGFRRFV